MYLQSLILGAVVGTAGTVLGGAAALIIGKRAADPRMFLAFAGGMMISVVFFDMFTESAALGGVLVMCGGAVAGSIFFALISPLIGLKDKPSLYSTGLLVILVIALHNLPEGLAIGSSLARGERFAFSLSLLLLAHNVPEGVAACLPLRYSGLSARRVIIFAALTGLPTAGGALLGTVLGRISEAMIAACIAFAGGAMLYISLKELIPAASRSTGHTKKKTLYAALGFCTGFFITMLM